MATLTTVTGAAWPTSGAASAGSTGFNTMTGGTHVGSTDVPAGSAATGYVRGPDNGSLAVRLDPTTIPVQAIDTDYWLVGWCRWARTAAALPTDQTGVQWMSFNNAGQKMIMYMHVRSLAHIQGLTPQPALFTTSGTFAEKMHDGGAPGSTPAIPFDQWVEVCVHISRSATVGVFEFYVNGVLIQRCKDINTDTEVTAAGLQAGMTLNWPSISGVRAEVCGPFVSYDGTGPALRPKHSLTPVTSSVAQVHGCDVADDVANSNGKCWTHAGTATRALTSYSVGGVSPNRKRWVRSGAGVTWSQTLIDNVGALPFNDRGWATLAFPVVQIRDGTGQIVVRNSGGTTILTLDVDAATSAFKQGATTLAPWTPADRYCVLIHFSNTGSVKGSLYNLSQYNTAVNAWSFDLGAWTVGNLGTVTISGANVSLSHSSEGMWVCRWATLAGVDSLSHGPANGLSPELATVVNMAWTFSPTSDVALIPNAAWQNRVYGAENRPIVAVIGRQGGTRTGFQTNVLDQLVHARGLEVINFDGGSVNDIASVTDTTNQASKLAQLQTQLDTMCDQGRDRAWRVWMTTMLRRPLGGAWSALQVATMDLFSAMIRATAAAKQSSFLHIRLSDPAGRIANHDALFSIPADYTHTTTSGSQEYSRQMILDVTTPPAIPLARPFAVGSRINANLGPVAMSTIEQGIAISTPAPMRGSNPQVTMWAEAAWVYDTTSGMANGIPIAANRRLVLTLDADYFVFYAKAATTATLQMMRTG